MASSTHEGQRHAITAWWIMVVGVGVIITTFGRQLLPSKFNNDAVMLRWYMDQHDLWNGWTTDSYINTARVWSLIGDVMPENVFLPLFYCGVVAAALRILRVWEVPQARYQLMAAGWMICAAVFLAQPSKEMIALPVALLLCTSESRASKVLATVVFAIYTVFFRQYWALAYFYFLASMLALRLQMNGRSSLAIWVMLVSWVVPFLLCQLFLPDPMTDARVIVNVERVDDPDAQSAFNNPFENTDWMMDLLNATWAWFYMNFPVALVVKGSPHYVLFAIFQLCSLWFFSAACSRFVKDAAAIGFPGSIYLRCSAFVIAYSLTQASFEPDFGSFLRHEVVIMIPLLVVVFYRAHAYQPDRRPHAERAYAVPHIRSQT